MKILILLLYYNRPQLVRNALESIKTSNYSNWHLAFIDDGSEIPGKPVVEEVLVGYESQITYYNSGHTKQQKLQQGGSHIGYYMTLAMKESSSDIGIMLCDDDALLPHYLKNLNEYFANNPNSIYIYSHLVCFDPTKDKPGEHILGTMATEECRFNKFGNINPFCTVDSSQVAWRINKCIENEIYFDYPRTVALDAHFYQKLYQQFGPCPFSGFYAQYKGIFNDQLTYRTDPHSTMYENKVM